MAASGSRLLKLTGIGPSGAARLLGDIGDVSRFPTHGHFASWNGTAPLDVSSGDQQRHRLSRAGNRRINRVLHTMAVVQLRYDTDSRAYYRRKLTDGKTPREAMRSVKRRLSDVVYRQLVADQRRRLGTKEADPKGQAGAATGSTAVDSHPTVDASDSHFPGPPQPRLPSSQPAARAVPQPVPALANLHRPVTLATAHALDQITGTPSAAERGCLDTEGSHRHRLANLMVTRVRQRVTLQVHGHRGRKSNDAWADRQLPVRDGRALPSKQWARLAGLFDYDDPTGEILGA